MHLPKPLDPGESDMMRLQLPAVYIVAVSKAVTVCVTPAFSTVHYQGAQLKLVLLCFQGHSRYSLVCYFSAKTDFASLIPVITVGE